MLKYGDVNPLTVFGLRQLEHCPPHFTPVDFVLNSTPKHITDWIWVNLQGRFYFGEWITTKPNYTKVQRAAFESPAEASYFSLLLDTVNNFDFHLP